MGGSEPLKNLKFGHILVLGLIVVFQRANLRILKNKVQPAITGAVLSPDAKCYTISESSGQPDSGNLRPTVHRVNLGCQPAVFATQDKISPPDFRSIYLFYPPSRFGLFGHKSQG